MKVLITNIILVFHNVIDSINFIDSISYILCFGILYDARHGNDNILQENSTLIPCRRYTYSSYSIASSIAVSPSNSVWISIDYARSVACLGPTGSIRIRNEVAVAATLLGIILLMNYTGSQKLQRILKPLVPLKGQIWRRSLQSNLCALS